MPYNIVSWSGGADSTATIILAHELGIHLDLIIFAEVMFDKDISGELPEHIEFIHKCIPIFESWGYEVKILHSDRTYMDCFNHIIEEPRKKQSRKGMRKGFVMSGHCDVQGYCKLKPLSDFYKTIPNDYMEYVGICADEPKRLARLKATKKSLLAEHGYTQEMARAKCREYGLLSPTYAFANRGGCWFCPNARETQLRHLRNNHRDLWDRLLELENEPNLVGNMWNTLTKTRLHDIEEQFMWEEQQMTIFDFLESEVVQK